MSKNKSEMKQSNNQVANVPNPPVPNRAHTEMNANNSSNNNSSNKKQMSAENKKNN